MSAKHDLIRKRLRDEGDKLVALFEGLTLEQWHQTLYTDGMVWSIKDLLAHQVSAERKFIFYGRDILNGGEGAPIGFQINAFNNSEVASMLDRSPEELLADMRSVRQATIEFVDNIQDTDFDRRGRHPFFGMMSIDEMFKLIYRHNMMHTRDVRRALGGNENG
jgi:uncharacterized protein (TIGR03083 family)